MKWGKKSKCGGFIWLPLLIGAALGGGAGAKRAHDKGDDPWTGALKGAALGAAGGATAGMAFGGAGAAGAGASGAGTAATGASAATGAAEGVGATSAGLGGTTVGSAVGGASTAGTGVGTATAAGGGATIGGTGVGASTNAGSALSALGKTATTPAVTQVGGVGGQGYWSNLLKDAGTKGTFSNDIARAGTTQAVLGTGKELVTPTTQYTTYGQPIQMGGAPQLYWGNQQSGMVQ